MNTQTFVQKIKYEWHGHVGISVHVQGKLISYTHERWVLINLRTKSWKAVSEEKLVGGACLQT